MEKTPQAENKMGVMPVPKLLITMSLPMIISMLVQALYNVVDSVFVAQINEEALTAVSLAFPVQNLMIAIAAGTGVGINALLSRSSREKNLEGANAAAKNGIFLGMISYLVMAVIGVRPAPVASLPSRRRIPVICSLRHPVYADYNRCLCGGYICGSLLNACSSPRQDDLQHDHPGTGAIINIVLDPILIFGMFGLPRMEVAGAALATVDRTAGSGLYVPLF